VPLSCGDEEGDEFGERERSDEGEWDVCSRARDPISSMKEGRDAIWGDKRYETTDPVI